MEENPFLSSLVTAWGGDEAVLPEFETDPFPDETLSPGMSEFIRMARRYLAGVVDDHGFVDSIQDVADRLGEYLQLHRQLLNTLPLSFPQMALGNLSTQALLSFSDGLSDMVSSFTQNDLPRVEKGIDRCKQAIIVLEAWWIEICSVVRHEITRVCPECGHISPPSESLCQRCSATLTQQNEEFQPHHEYCDVSQFWRDFYRNTQAMVSGQLPASQWSASLEEMRSQLIEIQSRLRDIPAWEEERQWLPGELVDAYDGTCKGLARLREGLEKMQLYTQDRQIDHLNLGWFYVMDGLDLLVHPCADLRYELLTLLEDLEAEAGFEVE